jgi:hypothetical protein
MSKANDDEDVNAPPMRWDTIILDVQDILDEGGPDFIQNNKIRYRYNSAPYNYHHILIINNVYTAFVPNIEGAISMEEFKLLKKENDYL